MKRKIPFEYKITIVYMFFGALWILLSDKLVVSLTNDPHQIQMMSTYKGWFYVLTTGILLYFLIKHEIQRRNNIHIQLLKATKKAEEANNLKSAFLSNLSHYIRSPMNSILGFVELMERKNLSPEKHQLFLKYINDRSQHLLQTINCIIEISKIQEGLAEVNNKTFKLNELINDILLTTNLELGEKCNSIGVKVTMGLPNEQDEIFADRDVIFQILSHLTSNAINFTQQGEIEIAYFIEDKNCIFFVRDSGVGILPEKQDSLFNDFMYNTTYTYSTGEGAGLGLHLSFRLANLIGGKLWLDYSGSSGSKFCLSIPIS